MFGNNRKVQTPGKISDLLVNQQVKKILTDHTDKAVDIRMIVIVTLDGNGHLHAQYAGIGGDITACGMLSYGLRIIQDGEAP